MNATLPPTPERAIDAVTSLSQDDVNQLLGWLCNRDPELILRTVADMRDFHERQKGTKP